MSSGSTLIYRDIGGHYTADYLSYGKFDYPTRRMFNNKYVDLAKSCEKRARSRFSIGAVSTNEMQKLTNKLQTEAELLATRQERDELCDMCGELHAEINIIIRGQQNERKN